MIEKGCSKLATTPHIYIYIFFFLFSSYQHLTNYFFVSLPYPSLEYKDMDFDSVSAYQKYLELVYNRHSKSIIWINFTGCVHTCVLSLESYPVLCKPMHCSPPGSSVQRILQARLLEWVAMPYSRESSASKDWTCISCGYCIAGRFLTAEPQGKPSFTG